jgi:tetratricopeptide (TPR) repeat protein
VSDIPTARGDFHPAAGFVGRSRELREIASALRMAQRAHGQVVMLSGEPGIGKTRIADEACAIANELGFATIWGRCWEAGDAPPYWPWLEVLRECVEDRAEPAALSLSALLQSADPSQRPDVREQLAPAESEIGRFALFDAALRLLKRRALARPLMIVLDDLHAADEASLGLLQFVARKLRGAAILLLGTYRDAEVRLSPMLSGIFGQISRDAHNFVLHGLSLAEVEELVRVNTGTADHALAVELHGKTGGNPFFLRETIRLMPSGGMQTFDDIRRIPIPDSTRSAVRKRLEIAPAQLHQILRPAAVIGREFDLALLQQVAPMAREEMLALMAGACAAGILSESGRGQYRFFHSLFRETIYDDLQPAERARIHLDIAHAMEAMQPASRDRYVAEIAHHYLEAGEPDTAPTTVDYLRRAARLAIDSLAYEDAARQVHAALAVASAANILTPQLHYDLLMDSGEALCAAGLVSQSRRAFEQAGEIAQSLGDPDLIARAALGRAAPPSETETDLPLVAMLERALASEDQCGHATRARMLARLGSELKWSEPQRALLNAERAIEIARSTNDPLTLVYALYWGHVAGWSVDNLDRRIADMNQAVQIAESTQNRLWALKAHYLRFLDLLEKGDVASADADLARFSQLTDELRLPFGWKEMAMAERALTDGRLDDAEASSIAALEIGRRMESRFRTIRNAFNNLSLVLRREQGRIGEVEHAFRAMAARRPRNLYVRSALAWCMCEAGKLDEARNLARTIIERELPAAPRDLPWYATVVLLSEIAARLSEIQWANALYDLMLPYAGRYAVLDVHVCYGPIDRYLGMLAAAASRFGDACKHFDAALDSATRAGAHLWAARIRLDYASCLLGRASGGDRVSAIQHVEAAGREASPFGLKKICEQAEALGKSIGASAAAQTPSPMQSRPQSAHVFRREGEVWHIARPGKSSRLKDSKGLGYIAYLLRYPGQEIHVLDLIATGRAADDGFESERGARASSARTPLEDGYQPGLGDAGEMLDTRAKSEFKRRLIELREELDDARESGDHARARKAEDEIDALSAELSRAVGLGGRDRRAASAAERARVNVTRAIKSAVERISAGDRELGAMIDRVIRTGTFCCYDPPDDGRIEWEL